MTTYQYVALSHEGRRIRRSVDAESEVALSRTLQAEGMVVLTVREQRTEDSASLFRNKTRVPRRHLLDATRALASLVGAGMPLARALSTAEHIAEKSLREILSDVRVRVERGLSLATALEAFPHCFSPLYVGMIRAGERSGDLHGTLARLNAQLERDDALRARLLSASIYPILLASAGGVAIVALLTLVLPRFADLLVDSGAQLPRSTALLVAFSSQIRESWIVLAAVAGAICLFVAWARTNDAGQRLFGRVLLALPLISTLRTASLTGRFARMTGVLLSGGATLFSALEDVANSLADHGARDEVLRIRASVREGTSLSGALASGLFFAPLLTQLVVVGEESGSLERFLVKAADLFDERAERIRQRLVAMAEPSMIIVFGGISGFVALSMLQAVYSVNAGAFR
jgi:type II secretory pathway component PulF